MIAFDSLVNHLLAQRGPPGNDTSLSTLRDLDLLVECLLELVRAIEVVVLRFAAFRVTADTGWPPPVWQTTPLHFVLGASTRCRNGPLAGALRRQCLGKRAIGMIKEGTSLLLWPTGAVEGW